MHRSRRLVATAVRICAFIVALVATATGAARAQGTLQFLRLHKLDSVADPANGGQSQSGVVQGSDGLFYGTAWCGGGTASCPAGAGTVFRLTGTATAQDDSGFETLYTFTGGVDGGLPYSPLIEASDGFLYGMTSCGGGTTNCFDPDPLNVGHGTIFKMSHSGAVSTVHVFAGLTEGTAPNGGLVQSRDGNLYGVTFCGGGGINCLDPNGTVAGGGTVFRFNPTTGVFTTLHSFTDSDPGGCFSLAGLVEDPVTTGVFYGTAPWCGTVGLGSGTVFRIDTSKNALTNVTTLHSFSGAVDGAGPADPLIIGTDGNLYGTAEFGGFANSSGYGTIFKLSTSGAGFTTLYTFAGGLDGGNPYAGLLQAHDGTLYGTTFYRSIVASQTGTVFRVDPVTRQFETLYTFTGNADGQNPSAPLVQIDDSLAPGFTGSLVGTTLFGPTLFGANGQIADYGDGVIFRFVPPPLLLCPLPVITNATSAAGASVSLSATLIDPANTPTTLTWLIDGSVAQSDFIPAASSVATSTRTTKSMTQGYTAGTAGTPASVHTVSIQSVDSLGLTSSCLLTVEVDKLNQTINFTPVAAQTYSNPNGTVTLNAASVSGATPTNLAVSFSVVSGSGLMSSSNVLTITGAGPIVVLASQGGNGEYNPAPGVSQTITVNKAAQTITFAAIANQTFANPAPLLTLTPTSSSGLPVTLTVTGPATLLQTAPSVYSLTLTGAGTVAVTATQSGDSNYNAATNNNLTRTFAVAKGSQTITFPVVAPQTFGSAPVTLTATASSGLAVGYTASGPGTISGNVLTMTGAGTIVLTASQGGNANFNAAPSVSQNVIVAKASQTITFTPVSQQVFGNPPVTLSASATSGLSVTYAVVSGSGTIAGNVLTITGAGSITVSASQAGNANFNAATAQQTIAVAKANQTIAFPAIPAQTLGNAPVTLAATASSGLAVSYAVSGPATISGNVLTITGAGTIVVTATQSGNTNYNSAAPVQQSVVVGRANQTITFPPVPTQFLGYPPVTLAATASSGLPVSYAVTGPGTLAGNAVTITGAGTIAVTASQGGDGNYNPAASVQQNITVLDPGQSPLTRFVVFSADLTWLHTGTVVATGDVGANLRRAHDDDEDDDHDDWDGRRGHAGRGRWHSGNSDEGVGNQVTVRLDNSVTLQQSTSRVVGDTVLLGPGSTIYNLVDNALVNHNSAILGVRVDTMALPYLAMPAFPAITAGVQNVTVKKNAPLTLAAGSYGRISVQNGATLTLTGGLYQMVSLDVDQGGTVLFHSAVQLRIQTSLDADSRSNLILDPAVAGLRASQVVIYVAGGNDGRDNDAHDSVDDGFGGPAAVNIGERAVVQANIYAPNGSIWLKSRSQATGAFIGQHVLVGSFSKLTLDSAFF